MRMYLARGDHALRRSMLSLLLVLSVALVPVACGDDDDVAVAEGLMEQWMAGWNDNDPDAIAAVFTEDGVFINEGVHSVDWSGREEIRRGAAVSVSRIGDMESTGRVTMTDDGTFHCTIEFRAAVHDMVAENEFEVRDGLISRLFGRDEFAEDGD